MKAILQRSIAYGLYPFLLTFHIVTCSLAIYNEWDLKTVAAYVSTPQFVLLFVIEFLFPAKQEWKMTWRSFFRDIKFFISGGLTLYLSRFGIGYLMIYLSKKNAGILKGVPFVVGFVITLLAYEFFIYWYHRLSHEMGGRVGGFLWRIHSIHHLPDKVYLLMHAVFHPLNAIAVSLIVQGVLVLAGLDATSLFLLNTFVGLQGLVSHYNVDIGAGFLNYIFVGTELHRVHHSADMNESKNYGQIISIWDIVFGTFVYKPGVLPERLGVDEPNDYPRSGEYWKGFLLPFRSLKNGLTKLVSFGGIIFLFTMINFAQPKLDTPFDMRRGEAVEISGIRIKYVGGDREWATGQDGQGNPFEIFYLRYKFEITSNGRTDIFQVVSPQKIGEFVLQVLSPQRVDSSQTDEICKVSLMTSEQFTDQKTRIETSNGLIDRGTPSRIRSVCNREVCEAAGRIMK